MDPLLERDPVYVARFKREARAAAALNHPGVVTVFDAGADGPTRYIVMEYVEGQSLAADPARRSARSSRPRRRIAEQIADALAAAHARRDRAPRHQARQRHGRTPARASVKVLDFGIARTADAVDAHPDRVGAGTAPYMAPEQAMGNPADARSDIYSLGCVLYEMLTGEPPFMGDVAAAVLHQHVRVPPKPATRAQPGGPAGARRARACRCWPRTPDDRPQTAAEVRDRLAAFETGAPTEPTAPLTAATAPLTAARMRSRRPPRPRRPCPSRNGPADADRPAEAVRQRGRCHRRARRARAAWVVLAVIALLLLGGAVAYAVDQRRLEHLEPRRSSRSHRHLDDRSSSPDVRHPASTPSTSASSSASSSVDVEHEQHARRTTTTTTTTSTTTTTDDRSRHGPRRSAPPTRSGPLTTGQNASGP